MIYKYCTTVTLGDTNVMQNMYFGNTFKLTGIVRELWIRDCVEDYSATLSSGTLLFTKEASCEFKKSFYLFDDIEIHLQFCNIRGASADLVFSFYKKGTSYLHALARQTVVFADQNQKITRIPANFLNSFRAYSIPAREKQAPSLLSA